MPPKPFSPALWRAILGLGLTQIIGYGTTYYLLGLMGGLIARDLDLSKTELLAGVSISLFAAAIFGPAAGRLQDRYGSKWLMSLGSILMAVGLLVIARAQGHVSYYSGWLLIALGSPTTLYSACFTALAHMAGRSARRAIIYLTLIGGLASSIVWPVTAWMLSVMGWREIVVFFAALNLVICAPIHALVVNGATRPEADGPPIETVDPALPQHALMRAFLTMTVMLTMVSLIGNAWSMLAIPILSGLGFSFADAVLIASLVGVFQVLGRVGELAGAERHSVLRTTEISNILFAAAFTILLVFKDVFYAGIAFAVAYGIANGLNTIVKGALTLAIFGSRGYGERLGKVTFLPGIGSTVSPLLGGLLMDLSGASGLVMVFTALGFLSFFLMVQLTRHCRAFGMA